MSTFFAEIKYQCVIEELLKRGYNQNVDNFNETKIIWTSLKTSPLDSVESDQFINHIQGSQHFSNKVSTICLSFLVSTLHDLINRHIWLIT
jgi:hypothetical protein